MHRMDKLDTDPASDNYGGRGALWIIAVPYLIVTAPGVFVKWLWAKRPWVAS